MPSYFYALIFIVTLCMSNLKSVDIETDLLLHHNESGSNISSTDEEALENIELSQRYSRALHGETDNNNLTSHRRLSKCINYTILSSIIIVPIIVGIMYILNNIALPNIKSFKIDYCNFDDKIKELCKYIKETENLYKNITSHN